MARHQSRPSHHRLHRKNQKTRENIEYPFLMVFKACVSFSIGMTILMINEVAFTKYRSFTFGFSYFIAIITVFSAHYIYRGLPVDGKYPPTLLFIVGSLAIVLVVSFYKETLGRKIV